MSSKSKKLIKSILCIVLCSYLTGCLRYNPPEGYSEQHHTYDEMVEYAKSLDPQATVGEEYTDTEENYCKYRIWPAVINGIECGVASESKKVWNEGMFAGEFAKEYYRFDTDHDYYIARDLLKKYPELGSMEDTTYSHFQYNDILVSKISADSLTEDELDVLWVSYNDMYDEFIPRAICKTYWLEIDFADDASFYIKDTQEDTIERLRERLREKGYLTD